MVSCFAPNIVTLQAEAVCRDEMRAKRKGRKMRDRVNEVAPSFCGAVYFGIRPGARFRHGAISRASPAAILPRPIVLPPARPLPQSKQHPGGAFPVDLVQLQPALSFQRPIPPARIVPS